MKRLLYLLFVCAPIAGHSQSSPSNNWSTSKNWKIYYVTQHGGAAYSLDTLQSLKRVSLNPDTLHQFLQTATEIPKDREPVFMGYYVTTYQLSNDSSIKVDISQYGAFFYDASWKKYYKLAEGVQHEWLAYLTAKWRQLEDTTSH